MFALSSAYTQTDEEKKKQNKINNMTKKKSQTNTFVNETLDKKINLFEWCLFQDYLLFVRKRK